MFAQRRIPPPFQVVIPFLVVSAALQMLAAQHATAQGLGVFLPIHALLG
jgi:hypothetical protein